jgi:predicted amidohydrolase YtcJ
MKPRALAYPDLILFNGKIRSFAADSSIHEALACAGGRIVATGKSEDIRRLAGPDTNPSISKGRRPSWTDNTHVHLEKGTAEMELIDAGFLHRCSFHRRT